MYFVLNETIKIPPMFNVSFFFLLYLAVFKNVFGTCTSVDIIIIGSFTMHLQKQQSKIKLNFDYFWIKTIDEP